MSVFIHATEADSFQLSHRRYRVLIDMVSSRARSEDQDVLETGRAVEIVQLQNLDRSQALRIAALLNLAAMQQIALWQAMATEDSLGGARYLEEFRRFLAQHFGDLSTVDAFESDR